MRQVVKTVKRVIGIDDIEQYDKPTNAFKTITSPGTVLKNIGEGESVIDKTDDRILIKKDGKFYKQVVVDNNIILQEA